MKRGIKITGICAMVLIAGCHTTPRELAPGAYIRYVEDPAHNARVQVRSGEWIYTVQYKPGAYMALKEQSQDMLNVRAARERMKQLHQTIWFNVGISTASGATDPLKYGTKDLNEYNNRLNYFLYNAGPNFHLTYGSKGEMPQVAYYFENNYSIKPEVTAIVSFRIPDTEPKEDFTLSYEDGLFNAGIIKVQFDHDHITALPKPLLKEL